MKNYLLLSLIIHSLLCIPLLLSSKEPQKQQYEVTLEDPGAEEKVSEKGSNDVIKELGIGEGEEPKNFYYGIGIEYRFVADGCQIHYIASGYSAESSGLQIGDIINLIDGVPMGPGNDIRGDGPKKLSLTIIRNSAKLVIEIERVKVYY